MPIYDAGTNIVAERRHIELQDGVELVAVGANNRETKFLQHFTALLSCSIRSALVKHCTAKSITIIAADHDMRSLDCRHVIVAVGISKTFIEPCGVLSSSLIFHNLTLTERRIVWQGQAKI